MFLIRSFDGLCFAPDTTFAMSWSLNIKNWSKLLVYNNFPISTGTQWSPAHSCHSSAARCRCDLDWRSWVDPCWPCQNTQDEDDLEGGLGGGHAEQLPPGACPCEDNTESRVWVETVAKGREPDSKERGSYFWCKLSLRKAAAMFISQLSLVFTFLR